MNKDNNKFRAYFYMYMKQEGKTHILIHSDTYETEEMLTEDILSKKDDGWEYAKTVEEIDLSSFQENEKKQIFITRIYKT